MHRDWPRLEKSELLERLAHGHGARIAVATPNRRLARSLAAEFAAYQRARGLDAWETAEILPLDSLVQRFWDDALYSDRGARVPVLLSAAQEQWLWEEAIHAARHGLPSLSAAPAAAQCRRAWQLVHAWRLPLDAAGFPNEDARAFLDWSARFDRATREKNQTDAARLPDVVIPLLAHPALRKPGTLVLFGMDIVTPQMDVLIGALSMQGCEVFVGASDAAPSAVRRVELTDSKSEIEAAAWWARARLESSSPSPRIGVVVPDLEAARARVRRTFAQVMNPSYLAEGEAAVLPFNISLGAPLAEYPIAADALLVVDITSHEIAFEEASRVIRSPFIAGAEAEAGARARLDAWLRKRCGPQVSLDSLLGHCGASHAPRAPALVERLARLAQFRKTDLFGQKLASEWAKAFSEALRYAGFPGERALDSAEHQALEKWHELLGEFATLERVAGRMGFQSARERLRVMARGEVFQPEARDVPIQVLGILESAGQSFDHLWVMGLTDEAWPLPARPDPFIPVRMQRAAGIPQSDPVSSLELDRRITQGWLASAPEVVVSHPRMRKESELSPSPLIASIEPSAFEDLGVARDVTLCDAIRAAGVVETIEDARAPPVEQAARAGGTGLFKDQAACPFRAFARRRLASEPLETPRPGLQARDRGTLVHEMMAAVWNELRTHDRLRGIGEGDLAVILLASADAALAHMRRRRPDALHGRYAALERDRLVRLAREWLDVDFNREPFEVIAVEKKHAVTFGGITVEAKLDRMDELAMSGRAIIDYKTGVCKTSDWMGSRPEEPQLPMYALGAGSDIAAVAFAVVKKGEAKYKGISRAPNLVPGVVTIDKDRGFAAKRYRDWAALVAGWRVELDAIGSGFASGDARVDPKRGGKTCENCKQQPFCRIAEKLPWDAADGEGDSDE
jgi:ATP-dependent helicase/nuclease subunit B